jgi:hypothetical protein
MKKPQWTPKQMVEWLRGRTFYWRYNNSKSKEEYDTFSPCGDIMQEAADIIEILAKQVKGQK